MTLTWNHYTFATAHSYTLSLSFSFKRWYAQIYTTIQVKMDGRILIHVKLMEDLRRRNVIRISPESTVVEFKYMIVVVLDLSVDQQVLVHINQCLYDDQPITSYDIF